MINGGSAYDVMGLAWVEALLNRVSSSTKLIAKKVLICAVGTGFI